MRWWRIVASAGSVLAIVAMLAWYGFTSAAGQAFAIHLVVERATTALHMPVTVGTIEWQGDRFDLRNLRLGPAGHLLSIRRVRGQLAWQALWRRELHLRNLVVDGARCRPSECC